MIGDIYDPATQRCRAPASGGMSKTGVATLVAAGALCVMVAASVFAGWRWWRRQTDRSRRHLLLSAQPPQAGELVTLVITDVQCSTALWDKYADAMALAMQDHHRILRARLAQFNGFELATEGDSFHIAFHRPEDALLWCDPLPVPACREGVLRDVRGALSCLQVLPCPARPA